MKKRTMIIALGLVVALLFCAQPDVFAQKSTKKYKVAQMNKNGDWEKQPYKDVRLNTETGKPLSDSAWVPYVRDEVNAEKPAPTVRWQKDEGDYLLQDNLEAEFEYAKSGNMAMFNRCLKVNKRLDVVDVNYMSLLSAAVWGGPSGNSRPQIIKNIIERVKAASLSKNSTHLQHDLKRFINFPDRQGRTPLWYAVMRGNEDVVKTLLENGAEVEWKKIPDDIKGHLSEDIRKVGAPSSVLTEAVDQGNYNIVRMLVEKKKPDILARDGAKQTALTTAILGRKADILGYLLDACPDKRKCLDSRLDDDTLLMLAVQKGNWDVLNTILSRNPSNILAENKAGVNVLRMATDKGDFNALAALVDSCRRFNSNESCINTPSRKDGKNLYQAAVDKNQVAVANWLYNQGAEMLAAPLR